MGGDSSPNLQMFSTTVGLLYVFNLIVGTGALALPRAFQTAGYLLGVILLLISAFTSYICATFVLESMAIANCVLRFRKLVDNDNNIEEDGPSSADGEMSEIRVGSVVVTEGAAQHRFSFSAVPTTTTATSSSAPIATDYMQRPHFDDFEITKRVEISEMAHLFLGYAETIFAYVVLTIYLFGDLAIYSTTVPKSLMNVICSSLNTTNMNASTPCLDDHQSGGFLHQLSRFTVYRLSILIFLIVCLPLILLGMTRTKWLQIATTLSRWSAFLLMIVLASIQLVQNGPKGSPAAANFQGFGSLFGVSVYAFMCHHSIPGLVTPMKNKNRLSVKLISIYLLVYLFYCALSLTGAFTFAQVQDIYTINFLHDEQKGGWLNSIIDYFLALFPVFVLTSSYVIVAITLSNNVQVLAMLIGGATFSHIGTDRERLVSANASSALGEEREALLSENPGVSPNQSPQHLHLSSSTRNFAFFRKIGIPLLVVLLPATISFLTDNVLLLASITGSFPGVCVQFVLPALLVLGARRALLNEVSITAAPIHLRSPFAHWAWAVAILAWSCVVVLVVASTFFR